MTEEKRNQWEANAIGLAFGALGTAVMVYAGAPAILGVMFYVILGFALIVWANHRHNATER